MFFYNQHFLSGIVTLVFSLAFIFGISKDMFSFLSPPGMHNCRLWICVISQLLLAPQLSLIFFSLSYLKKNKYKETSKQETKHNKNTKQDISNGLSPVYLYAYI